MSVNKLKFSFFNSSEEIGMDEDKLISQALTTNYEKVIQILNNIKFHLKYAKSDSPMINDLDWVISKIQSHTLYSYNNPENQNEIDDYSNKHHEVKYFFEHLKNFCEVKEEKRKNLSKTLTLDKTKLKKKMRTIILDEEEINTSGYNLQISTMRDKSNLKLIQVDKEDMGYEEGFIKSRGLLYKTSRLKHKKEEEEEEKEKYEKDENSDLENIFNPSFTIYQDCSSRSLLKDINLINLEKLSNFDFDIFEYAEVIGRSNVLVEGSKFILANLDLNKLISIENLSNFLEKIQGGYKIENQYHNDLHGFDVCQAANIFLTHTNLIRMISLSDYDVLAFVLSSLVHDLSHPGLNNNYQINSYSELTVMYNDKSVLESYHVSEAFRIMKNPESNILTKLDLFDFKHVRKRMIECILATDMTTHAKVLTLVKNKFLLNNIKNGMSLSKIINKNSETFIEDQQEILNFLIHTADISHNSRSFKVSQKWTHHLMEEFWSQGDLEVKLKLPVSFLCDRATADVPNSQIGFITSIIIPSFDILVGFLPSLKYFNENVRQNVIEWRKIVEFENEKKYKLTQLFSSLVDLMKIKKDK